MPASPGASRVQRPQAYPIRARQPAHGEASEGRLPLALDARPSDPSRRLQQATALPDQSLRGFRLALAGRSATSHHPTMQLYERAPGPPGSSANGREPGCGTAVLRGRPRARMGRVHLDGGQEDLPAWRRALRGRGLRPRVRRVHEGRRAHSRSRAHVQPRPVAAHARWTARGAIALYEAYLASGETKRAEEATRHLEQLRTPASVLV
jgi:hypothetical protein